MKNDIKTIPVIIQSVMNNLGIFFKEIHNNIIFNEYCKELTIDNQPEIINNILSNTDLINVLLDIVNDYEIVKSKIELIIGQKVKKIPVIKNPIIEEDNEDEDEDEDEEKCNKPLFYYQKTKLFTIISCV